MIIPIIFFYACHERTMKKILLFSVIFFFTHAYEISMIEHKRGGNHYETSL